MTWYRSLQLVVWLNQHRPKSLKLSCRSISKSDSRTATLLWTRLWSNITFVCFLKSTWTSRSKNSATSWGLALTRRRQSSPRWSVSREWQARSTRLTSWSNLMMRPTSRWLWTPRSTTCAPTWSHWPTTFWGNTLSWVCTISLYFDLKVIIIIEFYSQNMDPRLAR